MSVIVIVDISDEIKNIIEKQKYVDIVYREEEQKIVDQISSFVYGDIKNALRKLEYLRNKQKNIIVENELQNELDSLFNSYIKILTSIYVGFYSVNISVIKGWSVCGLLDDRSLVFKKVNTRDL